MKESPTRWRRGPRLSFDLDSRHGVYALFLRESARLAVGKSAEDNLLYIGLAGGRHGLIGRCHFNARTRNHSPRKSLAVLLMDELNLKPILIPKPNSPDTWGLDANSDARLSKWMHTYLELAIEICDDPESRETELLQEYAPPLNLKKCTQSADHEAITSARSQVLAGLKHNSLLGRVDKVSDTLLGGLSQVPVEVERTFAPTSPASPVMELDTAEAIAARFGLDPKSYRGRLRQEIGWYRKPQIWSFYKGSKEWNDMVAVANSMSKRS